MEMPDTQVDLSAKLPIVIDNGSGTIKFGFGGNDTKPALTYSSYVGRPKYHKLLETKMDALGIFVGKAIETSRGLLKLKYPVEHGMIKDWGDMEELWDYPYKELKIIHEEHPVLLTEPLLNSYTNREKAAEIFLEKFNAPGIVFGCQPLLALYASTNQKFTGVVLDCGDSLCQCVCAYDGFILNSTVQRIDIGGRDVTQYMNLLLRKSGHVFHTSAEMDMVKTMKEKRCIIFPNAGGPDKLSKDKEEKQMKDYKKPIKYVLPDGRDLDLCDEKYQAPEILFNPEKIGLEFPGVHDLLVNSINKADLDLKKELYENINIAGAGSKFMGFPTRILNELREKKFESIKLRIFAPTDREFSCWTGGAYLSSLSNFKEMCITKKDMADQGMRILHAKAL